jgi:hypothetical protein
MEVYYSPLQEVNQELIHKRLDFLLRKIGFDEIGCAGKHVALLSNDLHSDYEAYETVVAYMKARIESEGGMVVYVDEPSNNSREVIIPDGESVKVTYIDERIATSDVVISVNHIKANEYSGFSGAVNNTGWYSASLEGRRELVALTGTEHHKAVAEYAAAATRNRQRFHVGVAMDVVADYVNQDKLKAAGATNEIVGNLGIVVSYDMVAMDEALGDIITQATPVENGVLSTVEKRTWDYFKDISPNSEWQAILLRADRMGLGTRSYALVKDEELIFYGEKI